MINFIIIHLKKNVISLFRESLKDQGTKKMKASMTNL